jgi:fucose 4-O-acetylase-like acetyltransferase
MVAPPSVGVLSTIPSPAPPRSRWIDTARGTAILLVVSSHATSLPLAHAGVDANPVLLDATTVFAPYRMSLLFLLSGLLLERSLQKPWRPYVWGKVRALVWPFVLWMLIGRFVEGVTDMADPRFWYPDNWLWFIAYLALYYAAAPFVARIPGWWFAGVPLACWVGSAVTPGEDLSKLLYFAGFFFAGHLAGCLRYDLCAVRLRRGLDRRGGIAACLAVAVVLSGVFVARDHGLHQAFHGGADAHRPVLAPVVVLVLVGLVLLLRRTSSGAPVRRPASASATARWLRFLGENAVVLYLVHFPLQVFISQRLGAAGVTDPWVAFALCFSGALAAGLLASLLRRHPLVDALFVLPGSR